METCERCYQPITNPDEHGLYLCPLEPRRNVAPAVADDDIPGGYLVKHGRGLINADGSPKRYYSKTELRRACNEHNWTIGGDTPKPYKVQWSGKRKDSDAPPY